MLENLERSVLIEALNINNLFKIIDEKLNRNTNLKHRSHIPL